MNIRQANPIHDGPLEEGRPAGHAVVRLARHGAPVAGLRLFRGGLVAGDKHLDTWIDFGLEADERPSASPEVFRGLGLLEGQELHARVTLLPTSILTRMGGYLPEIPGSDVVQVNPQLAERLGGWALAVTPHFTGPVRVVSHQETPPDAVRFAYALRTLLALGAHDPVLLQAIEKTYSHKPRRAHKAVRWISEGLLGAPPLALRATEGLVGDDGRRLARVSESAFEYLGMRPGDKALLTWGRKSTTIRLLAQSDDTRATMEAQLSETTGRQVRQTLGDRTSRLATPPHLRAWVSSTTRNDLGIPPDTLVRVRRQVGDQVIRRASSAAVPAAALIIAALAVPSVPLAAWVVGAAAITALTALPIRHAI